MGQQKKDRAKQRKEEKKRQQEKLQQLAQGTQRQDESRGLSLEEYLLWMTVTNSNLSAEERDCLAFIFDKPDGSQEDQNKSHEIIQLLADAHAASQSVIRHATVEDVLAKHVKGKTRRAFWRRVLAHSDPATLDAMRRAGSFPYLAWFGDAVYKPDVQVVSLWHALHYNICVIVENSHIRKLKWHYKQMSDNDREATMIEYCDMYKEIGSVLHSWHWASTEDLPAISDILAHAGSQLAVLRMFLFKERLQELPADTSKYLIKEAQKSVSIEVPWQRENSHDNWRSAASDSYDVVQLVMGGCDALLDMQGAPSEQVTLPWHQLGESVIVGISTKGVSDPTFTIGVKSSELSDIIQKIRLLCQPEAGAAMQMYNTFMKTLDDIQPVIPQIVSQSNRMERHNQLKKYCGHYLYVLVMRSVQSKSTPLLVLFKKDPTYYDCCYVQHGCYEEWVAEHSAMWEINSLRLRQAVACIRETGGADGKYRAARDVHRSVFEALEQAAKPSSSDW